MLKKIRRKRKRKKSHKNYFKKYRYKIDNIYQKAKIKNLSRVWNFKNTMLKKRRRKRKRKNEQTKANKVVKIIKRI